MEKDYKELISFSRLKETLDERRMSETELAEKMGITQANISILIKGIRFPLTSVVAKICWLLKAGVDDICVFKGIEPTEYQKSWYKEMGELYTPSTNAAGEVTYRPLRRLLEKYLDENPGKTADDLYDKVEAGRRVTGAYDTSGKGIKAALASRGLAVGEKTEKRARRDYSKGLPYPTRVKLRQDRPLNIRTIYEICRTLGCTPGYVMSYK